jgi:tripartite-type tricarboxylate transporter receptor subunit TctC
MLCEYLRKTYDARMNHVPYKGEAPMVQDLLANQVQVGYGSVAAQKQHIDLGKLRALGTVTARRLEAMPDLPTLAEQGFPDEAFRMDSWFAVIAPKGVPREIQDRLGRELAKIMAQPDVKDTIMKMGYAAVADSSPAKLTAEYREWAPKWKQLAELSGARIDQ